MVRRLGLLGVFWAWMWLSGCFSGGEVINQEGSDAGLDPDDAAVVRDTGDVSHDVSPDAPRDVDVDLDVDVQDASDALSCEAGSTACDGVCVDTASSTEHCGGCGVVCEASGANAQPVCASGVCGQHCTPGWSDGDGDAENGCELECEPTQGGAEICDGVDNDCNGVDDDGFMTGVCTAGTGACETSGAYVCVDAQTAECDASPGTPSDETCADGVDNDCDGQVDEDDAVDATTWHGDADGDGFGDAAVAVTQCDQPQDYVANASDCDDADASVHTEVDGYADQDADGYTAGGVQTLCTDGTLPSGYRSSQNAGDCDDGSVSVHPGADEVCGDGVDNDCDGSIDDASAVDARTWYVDCDGDGFSADTAGNRVACTEPAAPTGCSSAAAAWTDTRPNGSGSTDCNDGEADAFPGQTAWISTPMSEPTFNAKWDYNCDGFVDKKYTDTGATCSDGCATFNGDSAGWVASFDPSCGQSEDYQKCFLDIQTGYCDNGIVSRTQSCH